jgi:GxxExxY protein
MKNNNEQINALTHKIIGCAMEVHNTIGVGFQEFIYLRSLAVEFGLQGVNFVREMDIDIYYKELHVGTRRVDFFVESKVMLEIKADTKILPVHKVQVINNCVAFNIPDGLIINFGYTRLRNVAHVFSLIL